VEDSKDLIRTGEYGTAGSQGTLSGITLQDREKWFCSTMPMGIKARGEFLKFLVNMTPVYLKVDAAWETWGVSEKCS
jgi:hypothetical protein